MARLEVIATLEDHDRLRVEVVDGGRNVRDRRAGVLVIDAHPFSEYVRVPIGAERAPQERAPVVANRTYDPAIAPLPFQR